MLNFAHRGARSLAPENTLPAIRKAWDIGADGVEIDVQLSADHELIILHDATLLRTTNVSEVFPDRADRLVSTFLLEELRSLDAGSWFLDSDPFYQISAGNISFEEMEGMQNLMIPTLEEVLLFVQNTSLRLNLELKKTVPPFESYPLARAVISLIHQLNCDRKQLIISSFEHEYLEIAKTLDPEIEINALIGDTSNNMNDWGGYEYSIYNANAAFIDLDQVEQATKQGCKVNLYTVNKAEEMRRYINWGISTLITDYPQTLKNVIDSSSI